MNQSLIFIDGYQYDESSHCIVLIAMAMAARYRVLIACPASLAEQAYHQHRFDWEEHATELIEQELADEYGIIALPPYIPL